MNDTDALRLARINLQARLRSLAGRSKGFNVDQIESMHELLDKFRTANPRQPKDADR